MPPTRPVTPSGTGWGNPAQNHLGALMDRARELPQSHPPSLTRARQCRRQGCPLWHHFTSLLVHQTSAKFLPLPLYHSHSFSASALHGAHPGTGAAVGSVGLMVADGRPPPALQERRQEPPPWHRTTWKDLLFGIFGSRITEEIFTPVSAIIHSQRAWVGNWHFLSSSSFRFLRNWKPNVPSEALLIRQLGPRQCHPSLSFPSQLCRCHRRTPGFCSSPSCC